MPHHLLRLPYALALALLLPAAASAQTWKVVCSDPLVEELEAAQKGQALLLCDDTNPDGLTAPVRATLDGATPWLQGLGFEPPEARIFEIGGQERFVAVVYSAEEDHCRGRQACFQLDTRYIWVHESYIGANESKLLVHELFHAFQLAHAGPQFFGVVGDQTDPDSKAPLGWISEGTAEAVGLQHTQHSTERHYDVSLTEAPRQTDDYEAAHFWLSAGALIGSRDRVAYFRDLLDHDELTSGRGEQAVHDVLKQHGGEGLDRVLAKVVARYANAASFYEEADEIALRVSEEEHYNGGPVPPLAAHAHRVVVRVPEGETADLRIAFEEDHESLHLVVEDDVYSGLVLGRRNVFRQSLTGRAEPYTFLVRVVNAAPDPTANEARSYTLEVEAEPLSTCRVEADGLGVTVCFSLSGPTFTGTYELTVPMESTRNLMQMGPMSRITDTMGGGWARLLGPTFAQGSGHDDVHTQIQLMAKDEDTGEEILFQLVRIPEEGRSGGSVSGGPFGTVGFNEGFELVVTEEERGRRLAGRFQGTIGACARATLPDGSEGELQCPRHTETDQEIGEHALRGTFSILFPEED